MASYFCFCFSFTNISCIYRRVKTTRMWTRVKVNRHEPPTQITSENNSQFTVFKFYRKILRLLWHDHLRHTLRKRVPGVRHFFKDTNLLWYLLCAISGFLESRERDKNSQQLSSTIKNQIDYSIDSENIFKIHSWLGHRFRSLVKKQVELRQFEVGNYGRENTGLCIAGRLCLHFAGRGKS